MFLDDGFMMVSLNALSEFGWGEGQEGEGIAG
jgi:hypothetical protein